MGYPNNSLHPKGSDLAEAVLPRCSPEQPDVTLRICEAFAGAWHGYTCVLFHRIGYHTVFIVHISGTRNRGKYGSQDVDYSSFEMSHTCAMGFLDAKLSAILLTIAPTLLLSFSCSRTTPSAFLRQRPRNSISFTFNCNYEAYRILLILIHLYVPQPEPTSFSVVFTFSPSTAFPLH